MNPEQYASKVARRTRGYRGSESFPTKASNNGASAIQQRAARQEGTGPAMGKDRTWRTPERTASAHSRTGICRIVPKSTIAGVAALSHQAGLSRSTYSDCAEAVRNRWMLEPSLFVMPILLLYSCQGRIYCFDFQTSKSLLSAMPVCDLNYQWELSR